MNLYSGLYSGFNPFDSFWPDAKCIVAKHPQDLEKGPGWLIIWGGGDIHPSFYGHPNVKTWAGDSPSKRDLDEWSLMRHAVYLGIGIIGVCRGAQMACALAGGYLIQHITNHAGSNHFITTRDGEKLLSSSLHHQMMYPGPDVEHDLIAWASPMRSKVYEVAVKSEITNEPEIIWFPTIKCLALQGHPEMMQNNTPYNLYVRDLLHGYSH